jgi:O-antigen/teichoic acid export membrane protein
MSLVTWAAIAVGLGLPNVVLERTTGGPTRLQLSGLIRATSKATAAAACLVTVLLSSGAADPLLRSLSLRTDLGFLLLIAAVIAARSIQTLLGEALRGLGEVDKAFLFGWMGSTTGGLLSTLLFAGAAAVLSRGGLTLPEMLVAGVGSAAISAVVAGAHLSRSRPDPATEGGVDPPALRDLLRQGLPLLGSGGLTAVRQQVDLVLVAHVAGLRAAAVYGLGARLASVAGLPQILVNSVLPAPLRAAYDRDRGEAERILRSAATVALGLGAAALTCTLLASWYLIDSGIVPPQYDGVLSIIGILGAGQLVGAAFGGCGLMLVLSRQQGALLWANLLGTIATVAFALAVALAPGAGGVEIAAASTLGLAVTNVVMWRMLRHREGIRSDPARSFRQLSPLVSRLR